jgi:hypothetical protein
VTEPWPFFLMEGAVACPFCDFEYTHFQGVEFSCTDRGPTRTATPWWREDKPGVEVEVLGGRRLSLEEELPRSPRRGAATLIFDGECGHSFGLTFEQHKGQEFVHVTRLIKREANR